MNKKTNWWAILAVVIVGVPIGFVCTSVLQKGCSTIPEPTPPAPTPIYEPISYIDAQELIKNGDSDKRLPYNCSVFVNGNEEVTLEAFQGKKADYSDFRVDSLCYDKDNIVTAIYVSATKPDVPVPPVPVPVPTPIEGISADEAQAVVASGRDDKRISGSCQVVINGGETKRYRAFSSAVRSKAYSDVVVTGMNYDANNYVIRFNVTATVTPPPPPPVPVKLSISEVLPIVSAGKKDSRIPDNTAIKVNGQSVSYKDFRSNVGKKYKNIEVTSLDYDDAGKLRGIVINASIITPPAPKLTKEQVQTLIDNGNTHEQLPQTCQVSVHGGSTLTLQQFLSSKSQYSKIVVSSVNYDEANKVRSIAVKAELKPVTVPGPSPSDIQPIVSAGQKSSKIPDGCTIVVNGKDNMDYQNFRMGVNYKTYTNVRVTDVKADAKGNITKISVTATEN